MSNISKTLKKELDKLLADMEENGVGYTPKKKSSLNRGSVYSKSPRERLDEMDWSKFPPERTSSSSNHYYKNGVKMPRFAKYDRYGARRSGLEILVNVMITLVTLGVLFSCVMVMVALLSVPTEEKAAPAAAPAPVATATVDYYPSTTEYETEFYPSW